MTAAKAFPAGWGTLQQNMPSTPHIPEETLLTCSPEMSNKRGVAQCHASGYELHIINRVADGDGPFQKLIPTSKYCNRPSESLTSQFFRDQLSRSFVADGKGRNELGR